jgi:hypothetical protein
MNDQHIAFIVALSFCCTPMAPVSAESLRLDVSPDFNRSDNVSRRFDNWLVDDGRRATLTVEDVEFTLEPLGDRAMLRGDWWKGGLDYDAAMASDGITTEGVADGLRLTIRGLAPGRHTLATYHNGVAAGEPRPLTVSIDGAETNVQLEPSHRVTSDDDTAVTFLEFDAVEGEDVAIDFRAGEAGAVILNGLELDSTNPAKRARHAEPAWNELHAELRPTLRWQPAAEATAHDIYFGTDREAVAAAAPNSSEYRGRIEAPEFATDADDPFATYFWRVDEVHDAAGNETTKGDVWSFRVRRLAFPGAEGYGRFAIGGRGGRVIKVTNLNDGGPGSLRAAIEADEPRTVVFDVSGRIDLQNRLGIRNPLITIAGQTAPGKGICISNLNLGVLGNHDVIIRYLRVRPGDTAGLTLDGMGLASCDHSIVDHCSISWTQDESFSSRGAKNITLQRTLISEALNIAGHKKYEEGKQHGFAASIGGDIGSFHHNLLAHCAGRNWSLAGGLNKAGRHTGQLDLRNNVVYNWGYRTTDGGALRVNFVNNYYKPGPATTVFHVLKPEGNLVFGPQMYYSAGNVMEGHYGPDEPLAGIEPPRGQDYDVFLVDEPFFESYVTTQSAADAYENVLADVGCNLPMLDDHDQRVIEETRAGTTTYTGSRSGFPGLPDSQEDVGGWEDYPEVHRPADWDTDHDGMPNEWEMSHGLDPNDPADGTRDADGNGYTNLEDYLNRITK